MAGPLTIVTPGANINTTNVQQLITDTSIPFTKLDTQNIVSFQTISLLFDHEPTQPPAGSPYYATTQIYQFPHGYSYIPSIWLMWQNSDPEFPGNPAAGGSATTFYAFGDDGAGSDALSSIDNNISIFDSGNFLAQTIYNNSGSINITTAAILYAIVDNTNVYINIMKYNLATVGGDVIPLYLAGVTLNIRCYIFTEPANTSTY